MTDQPLRILAIFGGRSGEHQVSLMSARSILNALDPQRYHIYQVGITYDGAWLTSPDGQGVLEAFEHNQHQRLQPALLPPDPTHPILYTLASAAQPAPVIASAAKQSGPAPVIASAAKQSPATGYRLPATDLHLVSPIDLVFPILHGPYGEDGALQGLLELTGLPYVGAGVTGSAVGMDKAIFKQLMAAAGLPILEYTLILRSQLETDPQAALTRAEQVAPYPLFVKPANLGSSIGITKCRSRSDLLEGLLEAAHYDRRLLVERGINAREIEISILGNDQPQASIAGEILPSREYYSYESKYLDNSSGLLIPAPLTSAQAEQARQIALQAYQLADCAGMARVDFLLDKETGQLYLNEINTIPGFTQISMYPKLWQASGLPYPALLDRLIELARQRRADRDRLASHYTPGQEAQP